MITSDQIGLYGKGAADVAKARADAKKAAEHAAKNFSKTKAYHCTVQPQPSPSPPPPGRAGG
jgi:hypothetical protein